MTGGESRHTINMKLVREERNIAVNVPRVVSARIEPPEPGIGGRYAISKAGFGWTARFGNNPPFAFSPGALESRVDWTVALVPKWDYPIGLERRFRPFGLISFLK